MLDDFVKRLEPFWADAQAKNEPVGALLNARAGEVADALLAISDERAARAKNDDAQEGLREAAPHRQEARRGRRAAHRPPDREVHQRRDVGVRAAARRAVSNPEAGAAEEGREGAMCQSRRRQHGSRRSRSRSLFAPEVATECRGSVAPKEGPAVLAVWRRWVGALPMRATPRATPGATGCPATCPGPTTGPSTGAGACIDDACRISCNSMFPTLCSALNACVDLIVRRRKTRNLRPRLPRRQVRRGPMSTDIDRAVHRAPSTRVRGRARSLRHDGHGQSRWWIKDGSDLKALAVPAFASSAFYGTLLAKDGDRLFFARAGRVRPFSCRTA